MARPVTREDFTHTLAEAGCFSVAEKKELQGAFKQGVTGKVTTSDQTVASSTALTAVPDLVFKVKKGKKYRIHGVLFTNTTGATGGIKATMTHSGQTSPTYIGTTRYTAAALTGEALTTAAATGVAAAVTLVEIDGYFVPDANGAIQVYFAQNTSNATGAVVKAGSFVRVHRA